MIDRRNFLLGTSALALASQVPVHAQSFPSRAISLYCAFPAGGPTDQVFRAFADAAARTLKQPVVVENKPGAGGTLAALGCATSRRKGRELSHGSAS